MIDEEKTAKNARIMSDEQAMWELFGSDWAGDEPRTPLKRPWHVRAHIFAHKAVDVFFKFLMLHKRWRRI